ncbi:response regulator [Spirosoma knui]
MITQMPIIYIEDDPDDQHLVHRALQAASIANPVRFFTDGPQLLAYLRTTAEQPLVILCDVRMPGMDGFEIRDQIEADEELKAKAVPFVYFSTWANKALIKQAYQRTIQGYHRKGKSFDALQKELTLIVAYWTSCLHPNSF